MPRRLICHLSEMEPGTSRTVEGGIAIFRTETGEVFGTSDRCTHEEWSLGTEGELEGEDVVCPLHMARYDVRTGKALCLPAMVDLQTYEIQIDGDDVYVLE